MNLRDAQNKLAHKSYKEDFESLDTLYNSLLPLTEHIYRKRGIDKINKRDVERVLRMSVVSFVHQDKKDEFQIGTYYSFNLKVSLEES